MARVATKCAQIQRTADTLRKTIHSLQYNDLTQYVQCALMDIQKQSVFLEEKYNALQIQNEVLKYDIHRLQQQLPESSNAKPIKSSNSGSNPNSESGSDPNRNIDSKSGLHPQCELVESANLEILENVDFKSLKLGDDKWAHKIFHLLASHQITFSVLKHPAVFTCTEAAIYDSMDGASCKNLFLSDKKNKNHFVLSALEQTKFRINDLKKLMKAQYPEVQCGKLQFAKETELNQRFVGM